MTSLRLERSFIDNHHLRSKYFQTCDQGSEPPLEEGNESSDDFRCTPAADIVGQVSSPSSARMRSGERAMAMTRNPSAAKRRTIAEPVPGPTPVTIAIGLSDIDTSSYLA